MYRFRAVKAIKKVTDAKAVTFFCFQGLALLPISFRISRQPEDPTETIPYADS